MSSTFVEAAGPGRHEVIADWTALPRLPPPTAAAGWRPRLAPPGGARGPLPRPAPARVPLDNGAGAPHDARSTAHSLPAPSLPVRPAAGTPRGGRCSRTPGVWKCAVSP